MKESSFIPLDSETFSFLRKNLDTNTSESVESAIVFLQKKGFSKLRVAIILSEQAGISIPDANAYILASKAWDTFGE